MLILKQEPLIGVPVKKNLIEYSRGNPHWIAGRITHFLWLGLDHKLADDAILRSAVPLTFSDRKTPLAVSIEQLTSTEAGLTTAPTPRNSRSIL